MCLIEFIQAICSTNEGRTKGEYFVTHPALMWFSVLQEESASKDEEVALAIEMTAAKLMSSKKSVFGLGIKGTGCGS
jgi:hypothetical protein